MTPAELAALLAASPLRFQVSRTPKSVLVRLDGEVDLGNAWLFGEALSAMVGSPPAPEVVVDLAQLTFIDLRGLRLLDEVARCLAEAGSTLVLTGTRPWTHHLMDLTGLARLVRPG